MNIDDELNSIMDDPLLDISDKELSLFNVPSDMKRAQEKRKQPDHIAQRKVCEDFEKFCNGFVQVHKELKEGKRSLIKTGKTDNMIQGKYYIIDGQLVYLENIGKTINAGWAKDGRTRCIYENGTESDILLQTLRKNVMESGYAITDTQEDTHNTFMTNDDLNEKDKESGYIYILSSLSENEDIAKEHDLYKIGFTINSVEDRIANAKKEPTYLMAPVNIVAKYHIVNLNSHIFETLIHQMLDAVQMQISVTGEDGKIYHPKEWYAVPLQVIDTIIHKILDGTITQYTYNANIRCLEKRIQEQKSTFDVSGLNVLSLVIKQVYFNEIISGDKKVEYRELKQTNLNKLTYVDNADGKRYLRRYDALRLFVGYAKNRESAIVQVKDTIYVDGVIEYHLGVVLEHLKY